MTVGPIDQLVVTDPLILSADMPIRRAAAQMAEADTAAAPVTDDSGTLLGVLTQKDCFRPALQASYYQEWTGRVSDFMSADPVTLPLGTDLVTAAEAFLDHPYRSFPVLDADRLAGMLRREDVFRALIQAG
ncbi:MAG: CBS domain-containing protein [Rhodobacteraceae bacterium]|nr:CBS domain-containing protein [Paracoccaceae bacterium]